MPRLSALLLSLIAAVSAAGESADLRVTLEGDLPAVAAPGTVLQWSVSVENRGPDAARHLRFAGNPDCFDTTLAELAPGQIETRSCTFTVPAHLYSLHLSGVAGSPVTPDPSPEDQVAVHIVDVITPPDLKVSGGFGLTADPGLPFPLSISWANWARWPATNVTITTTVPEALGFANLPSNCTAEGNRAVCAIGTVEASPANGPRSGGQMVLHPIAPDIARTAVPITVAFEIRGSEADFHQADNVATFAGQTFRTFVVTNANDSGEGSLRSLIDETNGICRDRVPCKIAFRIPAATGVITLRPVEPLPAIRGDNIWIDGTTQTRYIGDANPLGPEIEISGAIVNGFADGLTLKDSCDYAVFGLIVNGFPDNGILIDGSACPDSRVFSHEIADNYIGTDATGTRAIPNQRGIYVDGSNYLLSRNLISGNSRSGVFVARGIGSTRNNIIGLNATLTAGLGNGASGIYLAVAANDVVDNYIGFNAHFGVSMHPDAHHVSIRGNSFQANGQLAIDYGLDGFTAEVPDVFGGGTVRVPEITGAFYDAVAGKTVIEGQAVRRGETTFVHVYANDAPDPSGFGEGQYFLGTTTVDSQHRFRFELPGRLPGPWVAATVTQYTILGLRAPKVEDFGAGAGRTTSEFSRTVRVVE